MAQGNGSDVLTKATTKAQLAKQLSISVRTLNKWLLNLPAHDQKPMTGRFFTPAQANRILAKFRDI